MIQVTEINTKRRATSQTELVSAIIELLGGLRQREIKAATSKALAKVGVE